MVLYVLITMLLTQVANKDSKYTLTIPQCTMEENAEITFKVGEAKCKAKLTVEGMFGLRIFIAIVIFFMHWLIRLLRHDLMN